MTYWPGYIAHNSVSLGECACYIIPCHCHVCLRRQRRYTCRKCSATFQNPPPWGEHRGRSARCSVDTPARRVHQSNYKYGIESTFTTAWYNHGHCMGTYSRKSREMNDASVSASLGRLLSWSADSGSLDSLLYWYLKAIYAPYVPQSIRLGRSSLR